MTILGQFSKFLHETLYCGYSLDDPQQGTSDEYPQCMFLYRIKKLSQNYHQILLSDKASA